MKDIEMTLNWIIAWALALAIAPVAFVAVYVVYGLALRSYGLLEGGAL